MDLQQARQSQPLRTHGPAAFQVELRRASKATSNNPVVALTCHLPRLTFRQRHPNIRTVVGSRSCGAAHGGVTPFRIPPASAASWNKRLSWRVVIGLPGLRPGNSQRSSMGVVELKLRGHVFHHWRNRSSVSGESTTLRLVDCLIRTIFCALSQGAKADMGPSASPVKIVPSALGLALIRPFINIARPSSFPHPPGLAYA